MERRTSREKLIRVLTVKRKQVEHMLMGSSSRRVGEHLAGEKTDVGSSSSSSSVSSSSTTSSTSKYSVSQIFSSRGEFLPSCCKMKGAEVNDATNEKDQLRWWPPSRRRSRKSSPSSSSSWC